MQIVRFQIRDLICYKLALIITLISYHFPDIMYESCETNYI